LSDDDILAKIGVSARSLDSIRLARGVVGNTTYVACFALAAIAAVAWAFSGQPTVALVIICIIAALAAIYLMGTWIFAHRNPGLALLGGAELLQWRQMEMAAKELPILQDSQKFRAISRVTVMEYKLYSIAFRWVEKNPDPAQLEASFGLIGDWVRLSYFSWYVWSRYSEQ
jgi:hypothetical protein